MITIEGKTLQANGTTKEIIADYIEGSFLVKRLIDKDAKPGHAGKAKMAVIGEIAKIMFEKGNGDRNGIQMMVDDETGEEVTETIEPDVEEEPEEEEKEDEDAKADSAV